MPPGCRLEAGLPRRRKSLNRAWSKSSVGTIFLAAKDEYTITIANWAGVNTGDDAIFCALLSALRGSLGAKVKVYVLADNELEIRKKYDVQDAAPIFEFYRPGTIFRVLDFLRRSDLVIYGGGDLINGDLTSLSFLRMAKLLGVPVVCCGVGALPMQTRVQRFLARTTLDRMDLITLRDSESLERLKALGVTRVPMHLTADLAFLLLPKLDGNPLIEAKIRNGGSVSVGMNIRTQDPMYLFYSRWEDDQLIDMMTQVCDRLTDEMDANIVFLPMETCERGKEYHHHMFDDIIGRKIRKRIKHPERFTILGREFTPSELKGLLSHLDLLIAMRLHTLLIASDQGVPMIAFDYAPKLRSFMSSLGKEDFLLSTADLDASKMMAMVRKAMEDDGWEDKRLVQGLCERSKENIRLIDEVLKQERKSMARFYAFLPAVPLIAASNFLLDTVHGIKDIVHGTGPTEL
jgi:polysaccharide pyruvyl transferase CsaB